MGGVYFDSPSARAVLRGSEKAWLGQLARGPAITAWGLNRHVRLERVEEILALVPEVPDGEFGSNYLHTGLRRAQEQERVNKAAYAGWRPGYPTPAGVSYEPLRELIRSLETRLAVGGVRMVVAGVELRSMDLEFNTALAAGSDPVRLAAKIDGWAESHAYVEGPDRAWMADIIEQGLAAGLYRRTLRRPDDGQLVQQGWEQVLELLRSRDDEPVVLSSTVCDSFPHSAIADWQPPTLPQDWRPDWADCEGINEWEEMGATEQGEYRRRHANDQWYLLSAERRWELGIAGLRRERPWARLTPDTLAEVAFGHPVTVYDLFAPDRDERVRAAAALSAERADA